MRSSRWRSLRSDSDVGSPSPISFRRRMSHGGPGDIPIDSDASFSAETVAMLTAKERSSRLMHHSRPRERLRTGMQLIDMFLVIGSAETAQSPVATTSPSALSSSAPNACPCTGSSPRVLFQYPQNSDVAAAPLVEFCFPEGCVPERTVKKSKRRTKENSSTPSRFAMMAASFLAPLSPRVTSNRDNNPGSAGDNSPALERASDPVPVPVSPSSSPSDSAKRSFRKLSRSSSAVFLKPKPVSLENDPSQSVSFTPFVNPTENSFVFLITGHTYLRYGICIYKDQVIRSTMHDITTQPVCYCIVTAAPFLDLHMEVLSSILEISHIHELVIADPPTIARLLDDVSKITNSVHEKKTTVVVRSRENSVTPTLPSTEDEDKEEPKEDEGDATNEEENEKPESDESGPCVSPTSPASKMKMPKLVIPKRSSRVPDPISIPQLPADENAEIIKSLSDVNSMSELMESEMKKALASMVQYSSLTVPEDSHSFYLACRSEPFSIVRPTVGLGEESELIQRYAMELVFRAVPTKILLQLLAAILLEYKVIIVSHHYRLLSTFVVGLMPLLRPFEYQSSVIPILPTGLLPYLDAPVPLLVGCTSNPPIQSDSPENFFVLNLHNCSVMATKPVPALPDGAQLQKSVDDFLKRAGVSSGSSKGVGTDVSQKLFAKTLTGVQQTFLGSIFQSHLSEFVRNFEMHCISDVGSDSSATISVFMKESFLETKPENQHEFLDAFFETQMFKCYEDVTLRDLDRRKTEDRNSLRMHRSVSDNRMKRPGHHTHTPPNRPPPIAKHKRSSLASQSPPVSNPGGSSDSDSDKEK